MVRRPGIYFDRVRVLSLTFVFVTMLLDYLLAGISLATYVFAHSSGHQSDLGKRIFTVCTQIEDETSSATSVFYPGGP